jgi:hypothetical protein
MKKFSFVSLILLAVILLASLPATGRAAETFKLG